jgi:threonine/homoserine/homoserine lactone efflux protein
MLAAISPGPDFAVVLRRSAIAGRRNGVATALGVSVGVFVWVVAAAIGVAAVLAASAALFTAVKVVGAAYLIYLGVKAMRAAFRGGGDQQSAPGTGAPSSWRAFVEGLITNVANPKAAMLMMALVPQFLRESTLSHVLVLAATAMLVAFFWYSVVANVVGALRRVFALQAVRRAVNSVTGTALLALGVRVAVSPQP